MTRCWAGSGPEGLIVDLWVEDEVEQGDDAVSMVVDQVRRCKKPSLRRRARLCCRPPRTSPTAASCISPARLHVTDCGAPEAIDLLACGVALP